MSEDDPHRSHDEAQCRTLAGEALPGVETEFMDRLVRGAFASACCGFVFGVCEVVWLDARDELATTARLLIWAGGASAIAFSAFGALVEIASGWLASGCARSRSQASTATPIGVRACFACFVLAALTIGRWRYYLDETLAPGEHPPPKLLVAAALIVLGVLLGWIATRLAVRIGPERFALACVTTSLAAAAACAFWEREDAPARARTPAIADPPPAVSTRGSPAALPHVILIVADSLRADAIELTQRGSEPKRIGPANERSSPTAQDREAPLHAVAHTPHLDRFAREGIVFDALCAQSSWTKPGFASILTGLPPRLHRANRRASRLPSEVTTLTERFRSRGYFTFGHSNANPNNSVAARFDQGFDEYTDLDPPRRRLFAPPGAARLALYRRVLDPLAARLFGYDVRQFYVPADEYTDRVIARLRRLSTSPARPIFAVLHYMDPHYPYFGGARRGRPILLESDVHRAGGPALAQSLRTAYLGDVEMLDHHLGRLFETLRALDLYDEAIVAFTSDHGEEFLEHADWGHGRSLYQEVTHVPLILKLPGSLGAGTRIAAIASQTDLAPTLLSLAGLAIPQELPGTPQIAADGTPGQPGRAECHSTLDTSVNQIESLRTPSASYIRTLRTTQDRLAPVELYDRSMDPAETTNLAAAGDPRLAEFEARLVLARDAWQQETQADEEMPLDPDLEAQMRVLGYLDEE